MYNTPKYKTDGVYLEILEYFDLPQSFHEQLQKCDGVRCNNHWLANDQILAIWQGNIRPQRKKTIYTHLERQRAPNDTHPLLTPPVGMIPNPRSPQVGIMIPTLHERGVYTSIYKRKLNIKHYS